jgi:hypothetical protein
MIVIEDAELLSMSQDLESLGNSFSFRKDKSYSVNGRLTNYSNFSGVSGLWGQISNQVSGLRDYEEIFINGQSFGSGFITSINYEEGVDVREKRFDLSFIVSEKVDLFNMYGEFYSGVSGIQSEDIHYLQSISESFVFEKNADRTFSYSKNLNISMESGLNSNPTQTAKNIANILFATGLNVSDLSVFYPNFQNSGNKIYSETYNLFDFSYSFSEKFDFQSGDPFIWKYSHSLNKEGNSTVVTENGSIISAALPKQTSALIGLNGSIIGVYERCSGVLSDYNFFSDCSLINSPTNQRISYNEFNGQIEYDISFSNDNTITTGCITRINHKLSQNLSAALSVIESVEIRGLGRSTFPDNQKYTNAKSCYLDMLENSGVRISGVMSGYSNLCCPSLSPIKLTISDSESEGIINYSREYSCESNFSVPAPFKKISKEITTQYGVPLHQTFRILGFGEEVIGGCRSGNSTLSKITTNIEIAAPETLDFSVYLSGGLPYVELPSTGVGGFISDASYQFSSADRSFGLSVEYSFVKNKELFDRTIG